MSSRCEEFYEMCSHARIKLLFLPPYSPEFNPIELSFNLYKSVIKRHMRLLQDSENQHVVPEGLVYMWSNMMPNDGATWCRFIKHAGYTVPLSYVSE